MATLNRGRYHAEIEGDFVVFLIGMRINRFWKIHKWLPVAMAMPKMLKELSANKESGFLGARTAPGFLVQYWRSAEHLVRYARANDQTHFPAWVKFNKRIGTGGDVGIWHETFLVRAGQYETIYNNMPTAGLGRIGKLIPARGKHGSARSRLGTVDSDDSPVTETGKTI